MCKRKDLREFTSAVDRPTIAKPLARRYWRIRIALGCVPPLIRLQGSPTFLLLLLIQLSSIISSVKGLQPSRQKSKKSSTSSVIEKYAKLYLHIIYRGQPPRLGFHNLDSALIRTPRRVNSTKMSVQEQQHQEPAAPNAPEAPRPAAGSDDNLSCQWDKCSERCVSAEALFVS